jgi:pimeloyl-ACP methyl ester carboxylesterase
VHGAYADDSSWSKITPLLQAEGFRVTAVGNPLTSFADDVAATKRALAAQDGPTLLVGHSYGGVVITEAGNDPKVVSLVYLAAFAPDGGQSIGDISKAFPKPAGLDQVQPQPGGFLLLSQKGIEDDFAQDLPAPEKAKLVAAQLKTAGSIFEAKPATAAWRSKPTWYVVATNDRMIDPAQEKRMAKQINAKTTMLPASHVVMLSHPKEVASVIGEAATARQAEGFVEVLNRVAREGYTEWQVNGTQSVLGKTFAPFGLISGKVFQEFDLIHLQGNLLFWGARHVDGRGFDSEQNRPTNLQIPLTRR